MTTGNSITIAPATALNEVEALRPALESAIQHPLTHEVIYEEVAEVLDEVEAFRTGNSDRYFAVAISAGGDALGMMGLKQPDETMMTVATGINPIELVRAAVLKTTRGQGVGRALVEHLEEYATARGHDELILNSGPRYMRSGWPFWRRTYGEPVAVLKDYYGPRFDAPVWRTPLPRNSKNN